MNRKSVADSKEILRAGHFYEVEFRDKGPLEIVKVREIAHTLQSK